MRPVGNYGFPTHLRLSVGLEKENQIAMQMLAEVLKEVPPIKS
jgi:histidinol-phosphate aminotransferase